MSGLIRQTAEVTSIQKIQKIKPQQHMKVNIGLFKIS